MVNFSLSGATAKQKRTGILSSLKRDRRVEIGVPDIGDRADSVFDYQIPVDRQDAVIGVSSAVAPLWAGLIVLLNQQLGTVIGYLNP
jgi:kumamolisin